MTINGMSEDKNRQSNIILPLGSTSLASLMASDVAISWLAGDIANIMQLG